jgi:beta-lactamase class D
VISKQLPVAVFLVTLAVTSLSGQPASHVCVITSDGTSNIRLAGTSTECATRLAPASTYKIPHALIGLETGVITETTVEKWDGVRHPDQPKWNQDHTVLSSMKPSVVWFFQAMAPKIGAARAHEWLGRFHYGNADTGGDIRQYWLNGRLRVSPDEQLTFLKQFYAAALPGVSHEHVAHLQDAMEQAAATVENARGVHPLDVRWREGMSLNAKTGATTTADGESVSWLVGRLTIDQRQLVFVSSVWGLGSVDNLDAVRLAFRTFVEHHLLAAR